MLFSIFFFQAEDGIRDWSVTGVQTCALPILDTPDATAAAARFKKLARYEVESLDDDRYVADDRDGARGVYRVRSEERRVGKECRSRWSPNPYKRQKVSTQ